MCISICLIHKHHRVTSNPPFTAIFGTIPDNPWVGVSGSEKNGRRMCWITKPDPFDTPFPCPLPPPGGCFSSPPRRSLYKQCGGHMGSQGGLWPGCDSGRYMTEYVVTTCLGRSEEGTEGAVRCLGPRDPGPASEGSNPPREVLVGWSGNMSDFQEEGTFYPPPSDFYRMKHRRGNGEGGSGPPPTPDHPFLLSVPLSSFKQGGICGHAMCETSIRKFRPKISPQG